VNKKGYDLMNLHCQRYREKSDILLSIYWSRISV